jgi:hypothetical protein
VNPVWLWVACHPLDSFARLLDLIETQLTAVLQAAADEVCEFDREVLREGVDPDWVDEWVEGERDRHTDSMLEAGRDFPLWAYGGFMVSVLSWLDSKVLETVEPGKHPIWLRLWRCDPTVRIPARAPYLRGLLGKVFAAHEVTRERMELWIDARNAFVHRHGAVLDGDLRNRLTGTLGMEFDGLEMMLTAQDCRRLLVDARSCYCEVLRRSWAKVGQ